jgi:hypothetical protein
MFVEPASAKLGNKNKKLLLNQLGYRYVNNNNELS